MNPLNAKCYDSASTKSLTDLINDFINNHEVDVVNISFSSCYDAKKEANNYSACIVYREL